MRKITMLCLVCLLFLNTGCSWLALMDTSESPHDYDCERKVDAERESEASMLNDRYVGTSKERIMSELGKPKKIVLEKWSYRIDRNCFGKDCETKFADEVWFYEFVKRISSCGSYAYSIHIYFVDSKVARVER